MNINVNNRNSKETIRNNNTSIKMEERSVDKSDDFLEDIDVSVKSEVSVKEEVSDDAVKPSGSPRVTRLTNIIDQLSANKLKGNAQRLDNFLLNTNNGEGGGGGGRRCVRDASAPSPAHAPPSASPATAPQPHTTIKSERLSPHDNNSTASRSRSVTPSTSSYPGTPPERGSPHAPPTAVLPAAATAAATATGPRNYSDIMRSLAARYNTQHNNYYIPRMNGFGGNGGMDTQPSALTSPARADTVDVALGGLFTNLAKKQGGPMRVPAFPDILDMTSTKTLLAMSRVGRGGRESRRKRYGSNSSANTVGAEHSPLDLSAASESAAKRARLSVSPSTRSDSEDRDHDRIERDCHCAEARTRLSTWTVDDVCDFVNSIDICAEYITNFREQRIDGAGLPLLTEDHLTGMLQMKLGPALKLRAVLSARLGPCVKCQSCQNGPLTPSNKINGSIVKSEPRSNTTSPS